MDDVTVRISPRELQETERAGSTTAASEALADPVIPHRYQILGELGRGGMGIVYKVRDIDTREIVALKILKPEIAGDPNMEESLRREVCLARKVTHKNICRIYEFSRFEQSACISMEFIDGESLLAKLQGKGALPPSEAVDIARQICAGLGEAHAQGIVHRDLKPANIVISDSNVVKVMDFGIARQAQESPQTTVFLAGTPAYMSPEQVESKPVSARTDVYAMGLMLFEMVTGQPAFTGESAVVLALKQIRQLPPRPTKIVPTVPGRLEAVILKCLEKNPAKRFASVEELNAALETSLTSAQSLSDSILVPARLAMKNGARAASSGLDLLAMEIRSAARQADGVMWPTAIQWVTQLRWPPWLCRPVRTAQAAMVLGAVVLSTSVTFALLAHSQAHAKSHPSAPDSAVAAPSTSEAAPPFASKEFDFALLDDYANSDLLDDAAAARPTTVKVAKTAKAALRAPVARTKALQAKASPVSVSAPGYHSGDALGEASADPVGAAKLPTDSVPGNTASLALLTPAPPPADGEAASAKSSLATSYLEVGSFNDAGWADDAVNRLSQQGFHAIDVHKSHLWAQSYHVEVGPFQDLQELEEAAQLLSAAGFKPHAVK